MRPGEGAQVLADRGISVAAGDAPQTLPVIDMITNFNQETTLYVIDLSLGLGDPLARFGEVPEIRGRHPRCLPGYVRLETKRLRLTFEVGFGFGSGLLPLLKVYHVTRPASRDFLNPGNEKQLRDTGTIRATKSRRKKLLFAVQADQVLGDEMTLQLKEDLLACWVRGRAAEPSVR
ncbi:hypothetical protein PG993_004459 [Apiospora rasikravindrae]|uniref:Uncharacterized protein n=1 Tax=Apiospora rasikravindrae TaxID=990691 RepID=A0ABR1TET6_9PEZI